MRAEIISYMIYWEGPEYHEYVMHIFYLKYSGTPKYGNMLGNSLPDWASWSCPRNNRKLPKIFGLSTIKSYVIHNFLHEAFPGIFQVIISNGMVLGFPSLGPWPQPSRQAGYPLSLSVYMIVLYLSLFLSRQQTAKSPKSKLGARTNSNSERKESSIECKL